MSRTAFAVAASLSLLLGCGVDQGTPTGPISTQMCMPEVCGGGGGGGGGGGTPSDPAPGQPGIWIGPNFGPSHCYSPTGAGITDADRDRFDDGCEQWIAYAFRPALRTDPTDCDLRGEPAWSAKYIPATGVLRVGYFLSYYQDCGNNHSPACAGQQACAGHDGDSEFVIVDLRYESTTDHYLLQQMFFSAHWGEGPLADFSSAIWHTHLGYPAQSRGFPLVWVSLGKHANYHSAAACENGGIFDTDTCAGNINENRMQFTFSRNLGSPSRHMLDCTLATPAMQYFRSGTECYWDGYEPGQQPPPERFFGWLDPGPNLYSGGAPAYGFALRQVFEAGAFPCSSRPEYWGLCT